MPVTGLYGPFDVVDPAPKVETHSSLAEAIQAAFRIAGQTGRLVEIRAEGRLILVAHPAGAELAP